jgi:hypothetical protein
VAGFCDWGDEPSGTGATELVHKHRYNGIIKKTPITGYSNFLLIFLDESRISKRPETILVQFQIAYTYILSFHIPGSRAIKISQRTILVGKIIIVYCSRTQETT